MSTAPSESGIAQAVREALRKNFGDSTAKALDFYFDAGMVARNPEAYERMLRKTFHSGADHMVKMIAQEICRVSGVEQSEDMTLRQCVDAAKASAPNK
ncbi:MAG: hypothetical protein HY297_04625 [Thaumarchaeota archaeon]|nr:hypothetical protein [Nitrososphaerota archaeon]